MVSRVAGSREPVQCVWFLWFVKLMWVQLYCTCLWLSWDGFRMFWVQENGGFGKLQDEYKNDCLMRS